MGTDAWLLLVHTYFLDVWDAVDRDLAEPPEVATLWATPITQKGEPVPSLTAAIARGSWAETDTGVANTATVTFAAYSTALLVGVVLHRPRSGDVISTKEPEDDDTVAVCYFKSAEDASAGLSLRAGALTVDLVDPAAVARSA